jgi:hypothetical protein
MSEQGVRGWCELAQELQDLKALHLPRHDLAGRRVYTSPTQLRFDAVVVSRPYYLVNQWCVVFFYRRL